MVVLLRWPKTKTTWLKSRCTTLNSLVKSSRKKKPRKKPRKRLRRRSRFKSKLWRMPKTKNPRKSMIKKWKKDSRPILIKNCWWQRLRVIMLRNLVDLTSPSSTSHRLCLSRKLRPRKASCQIPLHLCNQPTNLQVKLLNLLQPNWSPRKCKRVLTRI